LEWSTSLAFSSPRSFNVKLSTFLKPCVSCLLEALCYSSLGVLVSFGDGESRKWGEGGRTEVGGENFGAKKGVEKSLGRARGCVFGSSPKWLEWLHSELVYWWLLVHSSPYV
jgi:hypothetical protein